MMKWVAKALMPCKVILFLSLVYLIFLGCNNPFTPPRPPKPDKVNLIYPTNGDTLAPGKQTLSWMPVLKIQSYHLQVSKTANFDPCIIDTKTVHPRYSYTFNDTVQYYWKVRVQTPKYHEWSDWSDTWSFFVNPKANHPPMEPVIPAPPDGITNVSVNTNLYWWSGDPDGDTVIYTVYFGDSIAVDSVDIIVDPSGADSHEVCYDELTGLGPGIIYYWKIKATDQWGKMAISNIWNFTTASSPDSPPYPPDIGVPPEGYIDELCTFTAQTTDPEGDAVRYNFDFGDGTNSGWGTFVPSGQQVSALHTYNKLGTLYVKAKAQDTHYNESEWSDPSDIKIKVGRGACFVADIGILVQDSGFIESKAVKLARGGTKTYLFDAKGGLPWHHYDFKGPTSLAVDPLDGCVWIACTHNQSIFKLAPNCSSLIYLHGSPDLGGNNPSTPCPDKDGNCWMVVALNKKFVKYDRHTGAIIKWILDTGLSQYEFPLAIALDVDNNWIWAVERNQFGSGHVSKWDIIADTIIFRKPGFNGTWAEVDPVTHYCWVADEENNLVRRISPDGQIVKFSGFSKPISLSINPITHEVWVADKDNNRVVKLSESGNELCSVYGLNQPIAVEVDPNDGSCWISDYGNGRIVKVSSECIILFEVNNLFFIGPMGLSVTLNPDP